MSFMPQLNVVSLLHEQYRHYTIDLGKTHEGLAKQYKKLEKLRKKLDELCGQDAVRMQRRKLTWSCSLTRQTIINLTGQQAELYGLMQQCRDLIASYNTSAYVTPMTPWTTYFPITPVSATCSALLPSPWSAGPYRPHPHEYAPQYWDLSMLGHHPDLAPSSNASQETLVDSSRLSETIAGDADDIGGEDQDRHSLAVNAGKLSMPPRTTRAASTITIDADRANQVRKRHRSEQVGRQMPSEQQVNLGGQDRSTAGMLRSGRLEDGDQNNVSAA